MRSLFTEEPDRGRGVYDSQIPRREGTLCIGRNGDKSRIKTAGQRFAGAIEGRLCDGMVSWGTSEFEGDYGSFSNVDVVWGEL